MEAAASLPPGFRGVTYQTLIGLLATTGMRLGEAISLDREDIDWNNAILTIHLTKFGKSRQVPIDISTLNALRRYERERMRQCSRPDLSTRFLVSIRGTQLLEPNVDRTFQLLVRQVGLYPRSPRCRPRVHDYADLRVMPTSGLKAA